MSNLDVGVGYSNEDDSYLAGELAAKMANQQLKNKADLLIVFGDPKFNHKKLLSGIKSVFGDIKMVGGTTAGEISTGGFSNSSTVIMALSSKDLDFITGIGFDMAKDQDLCAKNLVKDIKKRATIDNSLSLIIFPNTLGGDVVKVITGIQEVLGKEFEIVGGGLGDNEDFKATYQYYNGEVYQNTVIGVLVKSTGDFKTGIGVGSGFESIGNRLYCTKSKDNVIKEFDNENALELYKKFLGKKRAERLPSICLEYPFGLIDEKVSIAGEEYFQLRCGLSVDHAKGYINMAATVPEGSAVTLTTGSRGDLIKGARLAAKEVKSCLGDCKPQAILMFSCVGRKLVLGRRVEEEINQVKKILGEDVPIIGFYTYGEIGPTDKTREELSISKFHNETVVLWVLGSKQV